MIISKFSRILVSFFLIISFLTLSDRTANSACPKQKPKQESEEEKKAKEKKSQEDEQTKRDKTKRDEYDKWQKDQQKKESTEEKKDPKKPEMPEKPGESTGEQRDNPPKQGDKPVDDTDETPGGGGASRPPLDIGLQPRIQNITTPGNFLAGLAEPWEVWWTLNREKFLNFRQPVEWERVAQEGGTKSVVRSKVYDEIFNVMVESLQGKDMTLAWNAAIALGRSGRTDAIPYLEKAYLESKYILSRNYSLVSLGWLKDASVVEFLGKALSDNTAMDITRSHAAAGLGYINDPASVSTLKNALNDKNSQLNIDTTASVVFSLGMLQDKSAIPLLDNFLNGKFDTQLRSYAALSLGHIGDNDALKKLKNAVNDKDLNIRLSAAIALGLTGEPEAKNELISLLQDKNESVRGMAAISLAQSTLKYPSKTPTPKAVGDHLLKLLQESKREGQGLTIIALGILGETRAKPEFRKIMEDRKKSDFVKGAVAIALGLLKDKESLPVLTDLFAKRSDDPILAPYLIMSIGMIGAGTDDPANKKAIDALLPIWANADKNFSRVAYTNLAVTLTMLGKRQEVLTQLVKHSAKGQNGTLRQYALHTLGLVADKESAQALVDACKDENDNSIKLYAVIGMGLILEKSPVPLIGYWTANNNTEVPTMISEHLLPIPSW
ncbi:MAG: HEAT repeat domain-containing protein [Planctomycetota bacterium]